MRIGKFLSAIAVLVLIFGLATFSSRAADPPSHTKNAKVKSAMHPSSVRSPDALTDTVPGPNYGLFRCQVGLAPGENCYDPYQMRHAYAVDQLINAGSNGAGKTIVIVDAFQSPNIVQELNFYNSFYGLPSMNGLGAPNNPNLPTFTQIAPDGLTPFVPGNANMTGWAEEITLDVLWAHAIAPGANIVLVLAKDNNDSSLVSVEKYAVDNNLGDIISQSFGENESCVAPADLASYSQVYAEATQKNITIFASSGDQGASQQTCDGNSWVRAASFPASHPLVTGVGGTELHAAQYCLAALGCNPAANPIPGSYMGEIVWNEFANSESSGGGYSVLFDEPSYQQGTIHGGKQRGVPDVAYNSAVLHGVLTYLNVPGIPAGFYLFGGTSAGSPQWAAITAIADQKAGGRLGFINKALYHIGQAQSHYSASLHDVTSGTNSVVEFDSNNNPVPITGFDAGPGWDATTGLGSPIADLLVDYLIQFVSPGDGTAAIAQSTPHTGGNLSKNGKVKPH
jgi:subtilase family serine protease